jgi:predicted Na+-dependent transporter
MKVGDLVKHTYSKRTAIIIEISIKKSGLSKSMHEKYAKVLFSGDKHTYFVPLKILQDFWKVCK